MKQQAAAANRVLTHEQILRGLGAARTRPWTEGQRAQVGLCAAEVEISEAIEGPALERLFAVDSALSER